MIELLIVGWVVSGLVGHAIIVHKMNWWDDASSYVMFLPAMICGPFLLIGGLMHGRRR